MSGGTDLAYAALLMPVPYGTDLAYSHAHSTGLAYGAPPPAYARDMRCPLLYPVLTYAMPSTAYAVAMRCPVLTRCAGTDLVYDATRDTLTAMSDLADVLLKQGTWPYCPMHPLCDAR
eukprot:186323-Rhodomonas_salina.1